MYNADESMMQYCDGTNWIAMGPKIVAALNEGAMPTAGLVGHWKLDETSGTTAADSSGSGNNGTLTNMTVPGDWVSGKLNNALDFDGADDYVSMGNTAILKPPFPFTISSWVKTTTNGVVFANGKGAHYVNGSDNYQGIVLRSTGGVDGGDNVWQASTNRFSRSPAIVANDGSWHHIVAVLKATNDIDLYLDGFLNNGAYGSGTASFIGYGSNPVVIGVRPEATGYVGYTMGQIDDVRIYNRALTSSEIATLAGANLQTGLVGHWKLDETSGTTAADSSGNGNTGTMLNGLDAANDSVNGKIDIALDFDGVDDHITISGLDTAVTSLPVTLSAWGYLNDNTKAVFVSTANMGSGYYGANMLTTSDGRLRGGFGGCSTCGSSCRSNAYTVALAPQNRWFHAVAVLRGDNDIDLYIDGVKQAITYDDGTRTTLNPNGNGHIGYLEFCGSTPTSKLNGITDDVRVYARELSLSEITQLYCLGAPGKVEYNDTDNLMQFCSDEGLHAMGKAASDPAEEQNASTGLVGWWKLNDGTGSGTAADSSGNGNTGTLTNMDSATDWVAGKVDTALDFDGDNDRVNVADNAALRMGAEISIAVWAKPDTLGSGIGFDWMVDKHDGAPAYKDYYLRLDDVTGGLNFGFGDGSQWHSLLVDGVATVGEWQHFVSTYDGSVIKLYKNGSLLGESSSIVAVPSTGTSVLRFGQQNNVGGSGYAYDGKLDDIRIYNRALSAAEVQAIFTNSACADPVAPSGHMIYNADYKAVQYCNGTQWVSVGKEGEDPCAGSPVVGTVCKDGSVYAGLTPDGNVKMFVTPCDAGQSWSGSACIGARGTYKWNNGNSANYVVTGRSSDIDGDGNTSVIAALDSDSGTAGFQPHQAAKYCADLTSHGHGDWYLPARNELQVIDTNSAAIGGIAAADYWTSSESSATSTWRADEGRLPGDFTADDAKWGANYIRCARHN